MFEHDSIKIYHCLGDEETEEAKESSLTKNIYFPIIPGHLKVVIPE